MLNLIEDKIIELDIIEKKRKADYSIWGYLYQFDMTFYDILCNHLGKDLSGNKVVVSNPTYQIETVEDYIKYYEDKEKWVINLIQVKHSTEKSKFEYFDVLESLYYNFLFFKNRNSNFKILSSLFYSLKRDDKIDQKKILKQFEKHIKCKVIEIKKKYESQKEFQMILSSDIENIGKFDDRIQKAILDWHNDIMLDEFISGMKIKWFVGKDKIYEKIADKLEKIYNEEDDIEKKVIYSIGINYIIKKWMSKKNKDDTITIKFEEINNYINDCLNNEKKYNLLIKEYFREITYDVLKQIERSLLRENKIREINVREELTTKYIPIVNKIYKFIDLKFDSIGNRRKLMNTIDLKSNYSKEEYISMRLKDEIKILYTSKSYLRGYIFRIFNIVYHENVHLMKDLDIEDIIIFGEDFLELNVEEEERECILLPKSTDDPIDDYEQIFEKLMDLNYRPEVWYFDRISGLNKSGKYEFKINEIESDKIKINKVDKKSFYIECMECMNENKVFNVDGFRYIYCKECKDGNSKN